jgi:stage III sporulation protein AH
MKKPNLIIGKKQVILACLTLILGIAIYVNYLLSPASKQLKATDVIQGTGFSYDDVAFVNGGQTGDDYFAQCRIDRMTARDEAVATLQSIIGGGDITEEERSVLTEKAVNLSKLVETEKTVENLIKGAGFEDCVVYLDGTSASIVVKSDGLLPSQASQIFEILLSQTQVDRENIRILPVK